MKLITLLGPTCSGKSQLSVVIAKFYQKNGEKAVIVNCDSRQIYRELNLGTAKIDGKWQKTELFDFGEWTEKQAGNLTKNWNEKNKSIFENGENYQVKEGLEKEKIVKEDLNMGFDGLENSFLVESLASKMVYFWQEIPHFLIDFVPTDVNYNLVDFVQDWQILIEFLGQNDVKVVILTGGTGLWARAINQKYDFDIIKEEFQTVWQELKKLLEQENLENLQKRYLEMLAGTETQKLNESDFQNPIRLINWILRRTGQEQNWVIKLTYPEFESQQVFAIKTENDKLKSKIKLGIESRIASGLLAEVRDLLPKLGRERLWNLGLEYRQTMLFLENKLGENNLKNDNKNGIESGAANESEVTWKQSLIQENWQYARRQKTWLTKQDLIWVENLAELLGYL